MNQQLQDLRHNLLQIHQSSRALIGRLDELFYYLSFCDDREELEAFLETQEFKALYEFIKKDYKVLGEVCHKTVLPTENELLGNSDGTES